MNLKELRARHPDVILDEMSGDELRAGANGMAVFYASVRPGRAPKDGRQVLCAGYALTAGLVRDVSGDYLNVLRLTAHGNAKIDLVKLDGLGPNGNAAMFHAAPISGRDPRNLEACLDWD